MEIGAARDAGVPIFATRAPHDLTMREYVRVVPTLAEAVRAANAIADRGARRAFSSIPMHPSKKHTQFLSKWTLPSCVTTEPMIRQLASTATLPTSAQS